MKMPPEIAIALQDISLESTNLVRDSENKFGNYKYFSHDQLKEKIGKLMAKHGITMVCNEIDIQIKDKFMRCEYELFLYHAKGLDYGPIKRHIVVQANGPQAFGIASSYVQKYFLRDVLQIPTGDTEENDLSPKAELPNINAEKKEKDAEKIADAGQLYEDMQNDLEECQTEQDVLDWRDLYKEQKSLLSVSQADEITQKYTAKKAELKGK